MRLKTLTVIPTYDEREALPVVVRRLRAAQPQVDEGKSWPLLQTLLAQHPRLGLSVRSCTSRVACPMLSMKFFTRSSRSQSSMRRKRWPACT